MYFEGTNLSYMNRKQTFSIGAMAALVGTTAMMVTSENSISAPSNQIP